MDSLTEPGQLPFPLLLIFIFCRCILVLNFPLQTSSWISVFNLIQGRNSIDMIPMKYNQHTMMWDFGGYAVPKIPRAFLDSVVGYVFLYVTTAELVSSEILFLLPFFLSGPSFLSIACSN